ncbi:FecR domain-containing protein [Olivibacter sp. SDN3]|uniref:FecR family protein n=1 Tax=Olivibacter sp. SDN3 TaxID=2764720 RepID=UPI001651364B|nr:FecR domain-containing protein [Olivibacter sp. SDN3]QNL50192.1 FecR domain-containing protein [Olivibacter sp. SDN3]
MKEQQHYKLLIKRYLNGDISEKELRVFIKLIKDGELDNNLLKSMDEDLHHVFEQYDGLSHKKKKFSWIAYAAMVCLTASLMFMLFNTKNERITAKHELADQVKPGSNKAVLKLASGKEVVLGEENDDPSLGQDNIKLSATESGLLVYEAERIVEGYRSEQSFNTIYVPEGGQYQVILPDGSSVWLNSSSSLKYPVSFAKNERRVQLEGEGYFEVAKNENRPFYVELSGQQIKVLGTHFNISAYDDDHVTKTTLLEGSIEVDNLSGQKMVLNPGEQSLKRRGKPNIQLLAVDAESEVAWKEGNFLFNESPLLEVLKILGRWYAVRIDNSNVPNILYNGFISRNVSLGEVLKMLEKTGDVKFELTDGTIRVVR